jgi:hypothetical protein
VRRSLFFRKDRGEMGAPVEGELRAGKPSGPSDHGTRLLSLRSVSDAGLLLKVRKPCATRQ